ncbi:MAG: MerR family DNA-binding protein, partial [Proteobacteria bacterium]|nr:MerR family DNA-binding protein [Pseudomonadota bacterium]
RHLLDSGSATRDPQIHLKRRGASFIRHARELGFPLQAVRDLLSLTDHPEQPCQKAAGIETTLSDNIERDIWNKFVFLSSASAISGLSGASVHAMMADRSARALFKAAMEEIVRLGRSRGITLDEDLVERHLAFAAALPEDCRPSLLADLDAGRETEVDGLCGTVAKLGRQARMVTPIHRTAHAMIKLRSQLDRLKRDEARRPVNPTSRAAPQFKPNSDG